MYFQSHKKKHEEFMEVLYVEHVKCQYENLCSVGVNIFIEFVPSRL